jgi:hypothetical protein
MMEAFGKKEIYVPTIATSFGCKRKNLWTKII